MFILEINQNGWATMFGGVIPALFMEKKKPLGGSVFRAVQNTVIETMKNLEKGEQFVSAQPTSATRSVMDIQK